jgi:hypothetical protein
MVGIIRTHTSVDKSACVLSPVRTRRGDRLVGLEHVTKFDVLNFLEDASLGPQHIL